MTSHCGQCLETPDKTKYKQKSMHQAGRPRTETWRVQTPAGVHTHTDQHGRAYHTPPMTPGLIRHNLPRTLALTDTWMPSQTGKWVKREVLQGTHFSLNESLRLT